MALVHFPVYNKTGEIVVSSVTTLDVHDSSRICRTYGAGVLYIVTPLETQQKLVDRIISHWKTGHGATYNPTRKEALLKSQVNNSLEDVIADITARSGQKPRTIVTHARELDRSVGYDAMRKKLNKDEQYLLIFGTGWGLEKNIIEKADYLLNPIKGSEEYNHLPVRAAIAIILDRLLGVGR
ncbi:hypothetical protein MNBD_NITROSPINAE05-1019 [hydrothermal vent metagenome]|uniref:tRNA (guanine-N(1)-)-methyltransferase C-terminal domain-containing protein n=1 Tax=hydrothermal vent metagenome TaxID=652676 RepID=A0A3B1D1U2_9ZZZZ